MDSDTKKLTRLVIRQVHPDLFADSPREKQCNSESLKRLNNYVEELAKNQQPKPATLEFYVRDGAQLRRIQAQLTPSGSLAPLFFAFGFISADDLSSAGGVSSADDTNFLEWLKDQVSEAVRTAERHDVMKWHIRRLKSSFQEKHGLASVQIGAEYAVSLDEQENQVESLTALDTAVQEVVQERNDPNYFKHLSIQLYHTNACPVEAYSFVDDNGVFGMRTEKMKAYVGDDGSLHLVADHKTLKDQIYSLDLNRARMLAKVSLYWLKRVHDLTPAVTKLLGVRHVWCDTKSEQNGQKFVLWAGYLLEKKDVVKSLFEGRKFAFSIIVHADKAGPLINFHQSSPILNVRADCPAMHLINFLASEGGTEASKASTEVQNSRAKEEALLERVRQVFEARCVIKICMNEQVREAAMRLLDNADVIKQVVDLRGACIALDDCYEVWDSGFISIPYNFKIEELSNMLPKLQLGQRSSSLLEHGEPSSNSQPKISANISELDMAKLVADSSKLSANNSPGQPTPASPSTSNPGSRSNSNSRAKSRSRSRSISRSRSNGVPRGASNNNSSNISSSSGAEKNAGSNGNGGSNSNEASSNGKNVSSSSSSSSSNASNGQTPFADNGSSNSNRSKVGASAGTSHRAHGLCLRQRQSPFTPGLRLPGSALRPHAARRAPISVCAAAARPTSCAQMFRPVAAGHVGGSYKPSHACMPGLRF